MSKQQMILERIRVECATSGQITKHAIRLYVENRISRAAFMDAATRGIGQSKETKQ